MTRQIEGTGRSETRARNLIKEAARDRGRVDAMAEITRDTTVKALAEEWFSEIRLVIETGDRSPGTGRLYRDRLDNQILPAIGSLRLREVTVSRVDLLLKRVRDARGVSIAKATRSVLSGMFGLATRHDAIPSNPVRDTASLPTETTKDRRTLTLEEVWDLRAKIAADQQAVDWDLVDLVDLMMATGLRIGETTAITWPSIDLDAGTVEVRGTVIRIKGEGLVIKLKPKSKAGWRVIELPSRAVVLLKRRQEEQPENEWHVVFTSPLGFLRDPGNTAIRGTHRRTSEMSSGGSATRTSPRIPSAGRWPP